MTVSIDSFGLTDRGRVREANEDQFLVLGIQNSIEVRHASLPPNRSPAASGRRKVISSWLLTGWVVVRRARRRARRW